MRTAGIAAAVVTAFVPAAQAQAQEAVESRSVTRSISVPGGESRSLTLRCPDTHVAINGAVASFGSGVTVLDSVPRGDARRWTFRFTALEGSRERDARAVLRCVRLILPPGLRNVELRIHTRRLPRTSIPALSAARLVVRCPRGYAATGYGIERGPQGAAGGLPSGDVRVAAAVPKPRAWIVRLENTGGASATAGLSARCLKRAATGTRDGVTLRHEFGFRRPAFANTVGAGRALAVRQFCRASEFSVATGSVLDWRDDVLLTGSHPRGDRGGRWTFEQASGRERVRTFLVCLRRDTAFR